MDFATVPAAPPTRKNQRTTSWPAPISAIVPYQRGSRLMRSAFWRVSVWSAPAMSSVICLPACSSGRRSPLPSSWAAVRTSVPFARIVMIWLRPAPVPVTRRQPAAGRFLPWRTTRSRRAATSPWTARWPRTGVAADVAALLARHLEFTNATSPPEDMHALDAGRLLDPAVLFFSFRRDGEVLGVGALKRIDGQHAELKSMHTVAAARGRGIGRAMVAHLIGVARERGYRRGGRGSGAAAAVSAGRWSRT